MEAMRQSWTDDRMDDLAAQVESLRHEVKEQGAELRTEIRVQGRELREEMSARFNSVDTKFDARFDAVDTRFDSIHAAVIAGQRTMLQICGGLAAALIAAVATLVAAVL